MIRSGGALHVIGAISSIPSPAFAPSSRPPREARPSARETNSARSSSLPAVNLRSHPGLCPHRTHRAGFRFFRGSHHVASSRGVPSRSAGAIASVLTLQDESGAADLVTWRVLMNRRHVLHAMRLLRVREPSDHSEFIFAPKIDGFRAVCTSKGAVVDSCRGTAMSQFVAAAFRGDRERCPVSVGRLDEV
jgi:hypothetical protein